VTAPADERPIFLVGFMGAGKSTVGAALAARLGWRFLDTDAMVEEHARRDIETIFRESGEGRFRELEWEALRSLEGTRRAVVATGGGLFLGVVQRAFLRREGTTVWLDVALEAARARAATGTRPLWRTEDPIAFRAFFDRRRAAYALADLRVEAGGVAAEEIAARVMAALRR
jgi:shikimate kinase